MKETNISQLIRVALSKIGARVFRNNVAQTWTGRVQRIVRAGSYSLPSGCVVIYEPRPLHAGLVKGSADLIGWRSVTITPEMVGKKFAQFVSVEVKGPETRIQQEQIGWDIAVRTAGGVSGIVRSEAEALALFV